MRLFLVVLLLALAGCQEKRGSVFVDPALLALVPADTTILGGIRMEKLKNTAIYKKYGNTPQIQSTLDRLATNLGIDPRKDIWEIIVTSNGKDKSLVMARGSFSGMGLEPKIEKEGIQRISYKGLMMFGTEDAAVVFMNSSTAVGGKTALLRQLIDSRDTNPPAPTAFLAKLATIPKDSELWAISLTGLPIPTSELATESSDMARNLAANLPRLLGSLESSTVAINMKEGMHTVIDAKCPTEKDGRILNDTLRGLLGLARLNLPENNRDLLKLLDATIVQRIDNNVKLDMNFTLNEMESLLELLPGKKP